MKRSTKIALGLALMAGLASQGLRADDEAAPVQDKDQEMKVWMEHVNDSLEALGKKSEDSDKVKIEGFADIRYDRQKYTIGKYYNPNGQPTINADGTTTFKDYAGLFGSGRLVDQTLANTAAIYGRRAEIKIFGNLAPTAKYSIGYDFAENKIKDLGVEFSELPIIPIFDVAPEWNFALRVGQYRQQFGIEPQTSSSKTYFSERSILNGGSTPFGSSVSYGTVSYTAGANAWSTASMPSATFKLVGERVMGLHFIHKKKLGFVNYDLGATLGNNLADQTAGANKANTAFAASVVDENPSGTGRFGLEPVILNEVLPFKSKLKVGVSGAYDSLNASANNTPDTSNAHDELLGVDGTFDLFAGAVKFQGEYVLANSYGAQPWSPANSNYSNNNGGLTGSYGLVNTREGWYGQTSIAPLKFVGDDMPQIELLGRFENATPNVNNYLGVNQGAKVKLNNSTYINSTYVPYQFQAATAGLKWTYLGNNHTSINYSTYGINGNFNAIGDTSLLVVQQQVSF
jgi:hypothetical protein